MERRVKEKWLVRVCGFFLLIVLVLFVQVHPHAAASERKELDATSMEEWREIIAKEADKLRIAPINARVDRVWKAIPGYNGLEVDIERTLKAVMEKPDKKAIPYVYREIMPAVTLADLPAEPIYRGNPHKPMVAFMINVAWGNEHLPTILNTLKEENVKLTFFLDGSWLSRNKALAQRIQQEGHELSNHAYSHRNMSKLAAAAAAEEISKTEKLLKQLGVHNRWFAPPSGDYDAETVRIAKNQGLYTVLWTLDTVDWKNPKPEDIIAKINGQLEPGALILMHPTASASQALSQMIRHAKRKGYAVGTVSQLLSEKRVMPVEPSGDF